jgi:hypothetical protein
VLSVLLRDTDSDYPFMIFKLFLVPFCSEKWKMTDNDLVMIYSKNRHNDLVSGSLFDKQDYFVFTFIIERHD